MQCSVTEKFLFSHLYTTPYCATAKVRVRLLGLVGLEEVRIGGMKFQGCRVWIGLGSCNEMGSVGYNAENRVCR